MLLSAVFTVTVVAESPIRHDYATREEKFANLVTGMFTLEMTPVTQASGSLCSAATVVQTALYLSEGVFGASQIDVAIAMGLRGTNLDGDAETVSYENYSYLDVFNASSDKMRNYLNNINDISGWGYSNYITVSGNSFQSQDALAQRIYENLYSFKPLIAGVIEHVGTENWTWPYTTGGHFLNVCGIVSVSGTYRVCVVDPFYCRKISSAPLEDSVYWVDMGVFYNSLNSLTY